MLAALGRERDLPPLQQLRYLRELKHGLEPRPRTLNRPNVGSRLPRTGTINVSSRCTKVQIWVMMCVRSVGVTTSVATQERESAAAHASVVADPARRAATDRPRGKPGRATRLHAHPGSRRTRHQPLHLQPARTTPSRDARDALGRATDSRRRAATAAHRKAAAGQKADATRTGRSARRTRTASG